MINGNWKDVEPIDENRRRRLPAGGYVIRITNVENVAKKEYLKIEYDIAEGEHTGHYADLFERAKFWGGSFVRSYKESARGFFAGFLEAIEKSNPGVVLRSENGLDERQLIGKTVGAVLGEEEYIGNDGSLKTRLKVAKVMAADRIRAGDFTVPELKRLESVAAPPASNVIDTTQPGPQGFEELTEELPF